MKRGDVVLLVAQGDTGKPRPGVIVQANDLGDTTNSVLIYPMSSDVMEFHHLRPVTFGDEWPAHLDRALLTVLGLAR